MKGDIEQSTAEINFDFDPWRKVFVTIPEVKVLSGVTIFGYVSASNMQIRENYVRQLTHGHETERRNVGKQNVDFIYFKTRWRTLFAKDRYIVNRSIWKCICYATRVPVIESMITTSTLKWYHNLVFLQMTNWYSILIHIQINMDVVNCYVMVYCMTII